MWQSKIDVNIFTPPHEDIELLQMFGKRQNERVWHSKTISSCVMPDHVKWRKTT